tara:strand:- start:412 stop:1683 length:1272 start_codon:yes stop_codon:yes gene_type:complete
MKDCPPGKYYCNKEKKCMPIPRGYYVGARGWLKPDPDDDNGRKSKKNGNKNGNGHSGANGTSTSNGNGNGNGSNGGGGMSSESFEIDKTAHKAAQKKAKMRNLAKGNTNPNEKAAAEKKAGGPKLIGEGGMARQVKHSKSRSTAVLTANRGDKSGKENKARNKELGKKIRSMGYGYKKVKGEYPEKDEKTGKKKTVSEPSMAVNAPKKKFKKFKKQMKRLGKEYNQDAVITKKGKDKATLHPTTKRGRKTSTGVSRKGSKLGQVRPGKTGEYGHTKVGKKTYTYEATTLPRKNGQTMYVTFLWRGKYMSLQMFFPELKVPSKKEVQDALVKVYPGARCTGYDVVLRDPTKPILQLPEDSNPQPKPHDGVAGVPSVEKTADKLLAQKKEKQMQAKEKRLSVIKRMVLMKKIQAVRQGGGPEITA